MSSTFAAALDALIVVFSWPNILYPIGGTLLAMVVSILPGISGVALMAVVIPLTFFWEPVEIALLFGALVAGATFMGSITAILINVPGRTSNAVTALDGYPLSQQGKAKTAIASSATASALGSSIGVVVLILLIPVMIPVARAFGPLDMAMIIVFGLTTIAFVIQGSWLKGLLSAGLGMLLSFIGTDPHTEGIRYTFGILYLDDGLSPVLIFLGLFAVAEMIELAVKRTETISGRNYNARLSGSAREGIQSVFKHFGLFMRSSMIGTLIGMMPGVGSVVASFVAYGHAVQSAKDASKFGKGDIRGVIAPEAANDAKDGGALVPTLALGLPGGMGTAMLLTALTVHGVSPGPALLTQNLELVFVLIWSLFFSNWMTSLLGLAGVSWFARITTVPNRYLIPVVLLVVALAAYGYRGYTPDVLVVFAAGVFGYYLKKFGWPRIPFVIAMVLGPYFENLFQVSRQLFLLDRIDLLSSPIAIGIMVLTLAGLLSIVFRGKHRLIPAVEEQDSIFFTLCLLGFFLAILVSSIRLDPLERMVPAIVAGISVMLILIYIFISVRSPKPDHHGSGAIVEKQFERLTVIGLFLPGLLTLLVGPQVALPLYLILFLSIQTEVRLSTLLACTALGALLVSLFTSLVLRRPFDGGLALLTLNPG